MMPFVFFSTTQNNLCTIHNYFFNFINTSRKFRGVENRKTEIQNEGGVGGEDFYLCIYLL